MKVKAICNLYHGVTGAWTCQVGQIYTVKEIIEDPTCEDFVEKGIEPMKGKCYVFEGMEGLVHRGSLFEVVSYVDDFKFLKKW